VNYDVDKDSADFMVDYLESITEITDDGYIIMGDHDQKWHAQDDFAKLLEKFVDNKGTYTLVFHGEDCLIMIYIYIDGILYMPKELMDTHYFGDKHAMNIMQHTRYYKGCGEEEISKDEIRAFQEGMKYAWTVMNILI